MATANKPPAKETTAIAALSLALSGRASGEIQLLPAGSFRSSTGLPVDVAAWHCDAAIAEGIIQRAAARVTPLAIDYEHQTMLSLANGKEAPRAGKWSGADMEWREGQGLFALNVSWTRKARGYIEDDEYEFISPVIKYDPETGNVLEIMMASLTNTPALDGMNAVALSALAASWAAGASTPSTTEETQSMDKVVEGLLEQLRWMFNLPKLATPDDIAAELQKLQDMITTAKPEAATVGLSAVLDMTTGQMVALSAQMAIPDPAQFAPIAALSALQAEKSELLTELNQHREKAAQAALSAELARGEELGKISPALRPWAEDLGRANLAALSAFINAAPASVPIGTQTGGRGDTGINQSQHSDADTAVMNALGLSAAQYAAGKI